MHVSREFGLAFQVRYQHKLLRHLKQLLSVLTIDVNMVETYFKTEHE